MKKIMYIFFIFILCSCSSEDSNKEKYILYKDNIYLPNSWQEKNGMYGKYYSDFNNIIILKNIEDIRNLENEVKKSFNFYNPTKFSLLDNWKIKIKTENEYSDFKIYTYNNEYKYIKGKVLIINYKYLFIAISTDKEENINELYKKVFR